MSMRGRVAIERGIVLSERARANATTRETVGNARVARRRARRRARCRARAHRGRMHESAPENDDAIMARAASRRSVAVAVACAAVTVGVSRRVLAVACAAETVRATREAQTMMALRSLGVAPEAWTRATRADEARGDSRARERLAKKAFRRIALRAHPDKRRGANEVGDAFEAAAKAFETVRTTTTTTTKKTRRRAMRDRAVARTCATVSRFESFVVDRARGMIPSSRQTGARARTEAFEDASTSIRDERDDDDNDDDAHFATTEESFWTRAIRALEDEDEDKDEEVDDRIDVDIADWTRTARDAYPGRRGEREL